ncbi:hypothetical protein D3C73_640810 [compost metagenome]
MKFYINISDVSVNEESGWIYYEDEDGEIVNEPTFSSYKGPKEDLREISSKDYNRMIILNAEGDHNDYWELSDTLVVKLRKEVK